MTAKEEKLLNKAEEAGVVSKSAAAKVRGHYKGKGKGKGNPKFPKFKDAKPKQDFDWYNRFPIYLKSVANKAWNWIAGSALTGLGGGNSRYFVPGVMRLGFVPIVGLDRDGVDAYNIVARAEWLAEHRLYRGLGSYQQADLGIAKFGILDYFIELARAERMYGVVNYYDVMNRNIPDQLAIALHIDADAFQKNLADFRGELNRLILKSKQLCLPKGMKVFDRWITMLTNIFKDGESARSQMYVFDTDAYYVYNATDLQTGTCLKLTRRSMHFINSATAAAQNPTEVIRDLEAMLTALITDDDVTRMCSDLLAAVAKNDPTSTDLIRIDLLPEDYVVSGHYNFDWLREIHNMVPFYGRESDSNGYFPQLRTWCSVPASTGVTPANTDLGYIYQQNNLIKLGFACPITSTVSVQSTSTGIYIGTAYSTPPSTVTATCMVGDVLLDTNEQAPTPEHITEISRCVNIAEIDSIITTGSAQLATFKPVVAGSELFCRPIVYQFDGTHHVGYTLSTVGSGPGAQIGCLLTKFDWHPLTYYAVTPTINYTTGVLTINGVFGDLDNPVVISKNDISRINGACNMSLFVSDFALAAVSESAGHN